MQSYNKLQEPIFQGKQGGYGRSVRYIVATFKIKYHNGNTKDAQMVYVRGSRKVTFQIWSEGGSMITNAKSEEQAINWFNQMILNAEII